MVAAGKKLLGHVRKLAIRDEIFAMRLRGQLVVGPPSVKAATKPARIG